MISPRPHHRHHCTPAAWMMTPGSQSCSRSGSLQSNATGSLLESSEDCPASCSSTSGSSTAKIFCRISSPAAAASGDPMRQALPKCRVRASHEANFQRSQWFYRRETGRVVMLFNDFGIEQQTEHPHPLKHARSKSNPRHSGSRRCARSLRQGLHTTRTGGSLATQREQHSAPVSGPRRRFHVGQPKPTRPARILHTADP